VANSKVFASEVRIDGTGHVNDLDQSVTILFKGPTMSLQDLKRLNYRSRRRRRRRKSR
jgi:hypothetical protein